MQKVLIDQEKTGSRIGIREFALEDATSTIALQPLIEMMTLADAQAFAVPSEREVMKKWIALATVAAVGLRLVGSTQPTTKTPGYRKAPGILVGGVS